MKSLIQSRLNRPCSLMVFSGLMMCMLMLVLAGCGADGGTPPAGPRSQAPGMENSEPAAPASGVGGTELSESAVPASDVIGVALPEPDAPGAGPLSLSSRDLATRLAAATTLKPGLESDLDEAGKQALLEQMREEIIKQGIEILPDPVELSSHGVLVALLAEPHVINEPTSESARLGVRTWLYECHFNVFAAGQIPEVSPEDAEALRKNVHDLRLALEPQLYKKLGDRLDESLLKGSLDETEAIFMKCIDNPFDAGFKHPVDDAEIASLAENFTHFEENDPAFFDQIVSSIEMFKNMPDPMTRKLAMEQIGTGFGKQMLFPSFQILGMRTQAMEVGDLRIKLLHPDYYELQKERQALLDEYTHEKQRRRDGTSTEKIVL